MAKRVGIPRSMLYYEYFPVWESFFNSLNVEIIISPKTNIDILNAGITNSVDECCLPVKLFHGHVNYLKDKVDYIFIPKFISLHKKEYCCPKLLGLPDMIKHSINGLPVIIDPEINSNKRNSLKKSAFEIGKVLGMNYFEISKAYKDALQTLDDAQLWQLPIRSSKIGEKNILVLGHSYNVFDEFLNMGILEKLCKENINIMVAEDVEEKEIRYYSSQTKKRIFWTHGRRIIGSAFSMIENNNIDGIIYLSSFGCGLDSVLVHLVSKKALNAKIPIIVMTLDEQTGEAGFKTRLEAFLDMLEWRVKDENYISSLR